MYFGVVNGAGRFLDLSDKSTSNLCTVVYPIQISLIYDVCEWWLCRPAPHETGSS